MEFQEQTGLQLLTRQTFWLQDFIFDFFTGGLRHLRLSVPQMHGRFGFGPKPGFLGHFVRLKSISNFIFSPRDCFFAIIRYTQSFRPHKRAADEDYQMATRGWGGGATGQLAHQKHVQLLGTTSSYNHFASLDNISWLRPCMFNSLLGRTSWTCAFLQTLMVFQEVSCRPASGDLDSSAPLHKRTTNTERNKLAEITRRNQ